jgi:hypothetical protein
LKRHDGDSNVDINIINIDRRHAIRNDSCALHKPPLRALIAKAGVEKVRAPALCAAKESRIDGAGGRL